MNFTFNKSEEKSTVYFAILFYRNGEYRFVNSKYETLNPKQILKLSLLNPKCLGHLSFVI
jgi:hypothetical protein